MIPGNMKLNQALRAATVDRWHIVETTRTQNVAEHSYNVALIAVRFAQLLNLSPAAIGTVAMQAMGHDIHETRDGDVPSTAKKTKGLATAKYDRIVQLADKIEAYWFIKDRAIGPHGEAVVRDVYKRMEELVKQITEPDEAKAVDSLLREVLDPVHVL